MYKPSIITKGNSFIFYTILLLCFGVCFGQQTPLFNGKNLDGWINYGTEKWYVENGELICESGPDAQYGYLGTEKYYKDFILTLEFKQEADGNSGVFFRSTVDGTKVSGWQVEVAPPGKDSGGIYESYGRGWLIKPDPEKDKALKMGQWNKMKIKVDGNSVTTWLNDVQMIHLVDAKIGKGEGGIALQIHDGGGIKVRWRNIYVEELKVTEDQTKETSEWTYLFDGVSTKGWRAYNGDALPPGWVAKNGELTFDTELGLEQDYKGGKDIIYGAEEFDNFELYLEWKLPKGGNSGIFYHVKEGYDAPYIASPEYQLIDDVNYAKIHDLTAYNKSLGYTVNPGELKPLQQTGSDYAMHPARQDKKLNPIGEWNSSRIVFTPEKVEHWLNGKMVLSFVPWSEAWHKKKNSDKWKNSPDYGKFKKGYIGLQDHASPIWFRNIKIRKL